ncbi:MAG TPA: hypothetical protein VNS63_05175 [Blastocatellia bacterium]|nr:hypothetical protein [Blastocatellia bacterium]
MKTLAVCVLCLAIVAVAPAQKPGSPTQTVISFYRALREKRYVEGFRQSIYRGAIEGLTPAELQDLEPDFARTFTAIPEKIEPRGEQINSDSAIVFLKFEGVAQLEQVALVKSGGEWLVGDQDSLAIVTSQGRAFFFNARITVNEAEAFEMLQRIIGAEVIYSAKFQGRNATLEELIKLGGIPKDIDDGEASGYRFALTVSEDKKSFFAAALPNAYGKTGRLSFYADVDGIRAEDLKGQPASARSPIYQPK